MNIQFQVLQDASNVDVFAFTMFEKNIFVSGGSI